MQDEVPKTSQEMRAISPSSTGTGSSDTCASSCVEAPLELTLLNLDSSLDDVAGEHEIITAPLLARDAYVAAGMQQKQSQYGVFGSLTAIRERSASYAPHDPRLYVNTNAPFSAIVCGVQGSGKSHTVSVLLENMLVTGHEAIGISHKALSGLVLHFGEGGTGSRPCEAAWLGQSDVNGVRPPAIKVYVSRSSLSTMRATYAPLGKAVTVQPLLFSEKELDAEAVLSMMAVGSSDNAPLYIQRILTILRDLGEKFTYSTFLRKVEEAKRELSPPQVGFLEQRMLLLKTFVDSDKDQSKSRFAAGQLTIVDLSDPFMDAGSACALFEIVTRLFVRAQVNTGKVLVVDEAHKYLSVNKGMSGLTKALTALTRQQRHLAMRVIISTQEPTALPPVLIDLCSVAILHRFSSPAWWEAIVKHVSADFTDYDAFDHVVRLKTGEAVILAPAGLGKFPASLKNSDEGVKLSSFGRRYLLARTRRRVTKDGGASRLVIDSA
ncbi:uncharacterized protein TRAVEDRAFT_44610 [Trametes versicolor FP-101664 SS1]|uniref:uncharacterized protein n=1 Tax=Trametes versicolor (strain FP-101664) TaxID=717944 RepID=UPI0004622AA4|nr:uncharacterized protein TRAVEDRAFT_44610 [Trametes versicolor FP-101664 SS1]EIW61790.1 hypothetical protein TRAVEDRAFT_44610 [Trametes versicolor FP-101664 SS1]